MNFSNTYFRQDICLISFPFQEYSYLMKLGELNWLKFQRGVCLIFPNVAVQGVFLNICYSAKK